MEPAIANSSRRNGKPASCEPCRLNKTRCDHTVPKCNRCHQRGIPEKCFYHPAPLTKQRAAKDKQHSNSRPLKRRRASAQPVDDIAYAASSTSPNGRFVDAVAAETYRPGYLGPTSYAAIMPKDDDPAVHFDRETSVSSTLSEKELSHQHPLTKGIRLQMATEVLRTIRFYPIIRRVVNFYCENCQAGVVPCPLMVDCVEALALTVDKYDLTNSSPDPELVSMVLENSSKPLPDFPAYWQGRDFYKLCTGANLRLETLGWLLASAGRALLFGLVEELFKGVQSRNFKSRVMDEMLRSSTSCLVLCSLVSPVTDIMVWMTYENYLLTAGLCGSQGPPSWRRLGELATQIYALGLHKEPSNSSLPQFVLETRRRIFCASYTQDKTMSTFLGRPIRMSKRHTDIRMPLDLSDEAVVGDDTSLQLAIQALDENGWNTQGRYERASWLRLRFISSQYREEVLDFALAKLDECVERKLEDISRRIKESWEAVPQHLRLGQGFWEIDLSPTIRVMLIVVYLTHFYSEFMIRKLLDHIPLCENVALLRVSMDLLSHTLTLGSVQDRAYDVYRDTMQAILIFGIPSGSVLATALKDQHQTGQHFPTSISRAEIIRMLSVLISHLDSAAHVDTSGARKGDGNYEVCRKAAKMFTKVIDAILEPNPRTSTVTPTSIDLDLGLDFFNPPGLDGFDGMELSGPDEGAGIGWGAFAQWTL